MLDEPERVQILDSLIAISGQALLVRMAAQKAKIYKSASELMTFITSLRDHQRCFGQAEDLKYLVMGGRLVCYKAQPTDEELNHARELEPVLGLKLVGDRSLLLSDGATRRRILTFEKVAKPTIPLPRRAGMAQKKPL